MRAMSLLTFFVTRYTRRSMLQLYLLSLGPGRALVKNVREALCSRDDREFTADLTLKSKFLTLPPMRPPHPRRPYTLRDCTSVITARSKTRKNPTRRRVYRFHAQPHVSRQCSENLSNAVSPRLFCLSYPMHLVAQAFPDGILFCFVQIDKYSHT